MTPEQAKQKKLVIYTLIVLGFAGLIAAHEFTGTDENADITMPFILATAGTLCFVGAGLLARRLMKRMASK
jgi:Ca2+/Na+ antiporter